MAKLAKTPSERIDEPRDCVKAMSKKACEEILSAQQATQDDGESVNLEECIDNPNPRCEEALRTALDAQLAASHDAGE